MVTFWYMDNGEKVIVAGIERIEGSRQDWITVDGMDGQVYDVHVENIVTMM